MSGQATGSKATAKGVAVSSFQGEEVAGEKHSTSPEGLERQKDRQQITAEDWSWMEEVFLHDTARLFNILMHLVITTK